MKLLVLRPCVGAAATAARARSAGHEPITAPLFEYHPLPWTPPDPATIDALLFTSAAAVRLGGAGLGGFKALPVQAVGLATADAARDAGFGRVTSGRTDARAAAAMLADRGHRTILHLAGRDVVAVDHPLLVIDRIAVYAAEAVERLPDGAHAALDDNAVVLLHSPRAARVFAALLEREGRVRDVVRVACFSRAVAEAAGGGWAGVAVAAVPTDDALFAAAGLLCDQAGNGTVEPR